MKRFLWRFVRFLAAFFFGLLALALVIFLVFGYPNDARIAPFPLERLTVHEQAFERSGSLLLSSWEHALDVDFAAFANLRRLAMAELPASVLVDSKRFVSPYQMYVPAGSYPVRLEAMDGLYIPAGASLTVRPALAGSHSLRYFGLAVGAAAQIDVTATYEDGKKRELGSLALPDPRQAYLSRKSLAGVIADHWTPDRTAQILAWTPARLAVEADQGMRLVFTCRGNERGCLLGDPTLLRPLVGTTPRPQNVIVILVDTLRYDALAGGHAPHLEALAARSTEFTHASAPGNMTSPSTNALLSCQKPSSLGSLAFSYGIDSSMREDFYAKAEPSFPAVFAHGGYETAMIGNVSVLSEVYGVGVSHGFQRQIAIEVDAYDTPFVTREALSWLEQNGDHPFVLYLHYHGPHAPYRSPLRDMMATWPGRHSLASYANALLWIYQGEIRYTDRYLGQLLDGISRLGLSQNTTLVVTADHGDQHKQRQWHGNVVGPNLAGAYFDHGASLHGDEIRVPLIVHRPHQEQREVASSHVSTLALGPSLLRMNGLEVPSYCSAPPLPELLAGQEKVDALASKRADFGSEGFRGRAIVFDGRYKYIRTYEPTDKVLFTPTAWRSRRTLYMAPEQLFDLVQDPEEEHDLAPTRKELLHEARARYRQFYAIKDAYEIIVEDPKGQGFRLELPRGVHVTDAAKYAVVSDSAEALHVSGTGKAGRTLLTVRNWDGRAWPRALIGRDEVATLATAMRLPLTLLPAELPIEPTGASSLLVSSTSSAPRVYIRRIEDDGQGERRISVGNPQFEKVLREWGYLNDSP